MTVHVKFGSTATLPCDYSTSQYAYWQRGQDVAFSMKNGIPETKHISPIYVNRTSVNAINFSLELSHTQISDEGNYDCYVSYQDKVEVRKTVKLSIVASYSKPSISVSEFWKFNNSATAINVTCSSTGGYPNATLHWINENENCTLENGPEPESIQDSITKLYNITSQLTVIIKVNTTLVCLVENTETQEVITAVINLSPHQLEKYDSVLICVATAFSFCILAASILALKRRKPQPCNHNGEPCTCIRCKERNLETETTQEMIDHTLPTVASRTSETTSPTPSAPEGHFYVEAYNI
ncbi:T-lymphocyte activation antigen CD80 [Protopterus annectens]|uniref:T-lymphocyte activation antigen CD80 n=1 Tax=Protopterus annectens TaxID=7888 RepID=UPI001CFAA7C4|nr:T-lymphocyte activation antigen CD80 [Protopterus annectens]